MSARIATTAPPPPLRKTGEWALFRLLDDADPKSVAGSKLEVEYVWHLQHDTYRVSVPYVFRVRRMPNPFDRGFFRDFTCPGNLGG